MNAANAGAVMMFSSVAVVVGVFLTILAIVSVVKVIQIAEDVRYLRSKSDIHVKRPMPWSTILVICLGVAVGVSVLALFLFAGAFSSTMVGR